MLTLIRKTNERTLLALPDGREVWVTICGIFGNKVRLGFTAPRDVKIMREEIIGRDFSSGAVPLSPQP